MNVLVYSGPQVVQTSLDHTLSSLRLLFSPNYSVQTISQQPLTSDPWSPTCALLVFPECRDLSSSPAIGAVKAFVENGGALLALSPTAAASSSGTELGIMDAITGTAKDIRVQVFQKTSQSYISPLPHDSSDSRKHALTVGFKMSDSNSWAKFIERDKVEGEIAAVRCVLGAGKAILWGPSLANASKENQTSSLTAPSLTSMEETHNVMKGTLQGLSLTFPSRDLQSIPRPLPQFLTSHPAKRLNYREIIGDIYTSPLLSFKDTNDSFAFHALADSAEILQESREAPISDPAAASLECKHIILCEGAELPSPEHTRLFDLNMYYRAITAARSKAGIPEGTDRWGMGELLLYGEVVTSTQTMLDKNQRLLALFPSPLLSVASYQLSGRGRGTNVWLSPKGCLQFSLLHRVPLVTIPASKLVFVQYLFSLAVTEACRDDAVLGKYGEGVRIKWPNDLYAPVGDDDNGEGMKKVGGILVNTFFREQLVDVVIGCGLNLFTSPPISSLSQLLPSQEWCFMTMERTVAVIMAKFEGMWTTFCKHGGSFDPFMDLYLERWLHSDQLVTLTTTVPPTLVRVAGITRDHGLLRTVPERTGWSTGSDGFIDLQPDGNSFDLMAGLIKTKT